MTLRQTSSETPFRLDPAVARAAKVQKREQEVLFQAENTQEVDGYSLRPAVGRTGGVSNEGWEVVPPKGHGPVWYLRDRQTALEAIPRHRGRYAA